MGRTSPYRPTFSLDKTTTQTEGANAPVTDRLAKSFLLRLGTSVVALEPSVDEL